MSIDRFSRPMNWLKRQLPADTAARPLPRLRFCAGHVPEVCSATSAPVESAARPATLSLDELLTASEECWSEVTPSRASDQHVIDIATARRMKRSWLTRKAAA